MNIFEDRNCMVATYALAAVAKLGMESLDWDPLVLRDAFLQLFDCKLSQKGFDKLQAGMTMIGTNLFNTSIEVFLACTSLCSNKSVRLGLLSYVTLKDCCWSIFVYNDLNGLPSDFDPDIVVYINQLMNLDGISKLPDYMSFANLPDLKMTQIQLALIADLTAFSAYNMRQQLNVNEIKAYIKDQQRILIQQLKIIDPIIHPKDSLKTAKK